MLVYQRVPKVAVVVLVNTESSSKDCVLVA